jgi:Tfp pilus assembly protein PilX
MNIASKPSNLPEGRSDQRGVVLFTALVLLIILTLVGVLLARSESVEESISENDQDHELAIQAAEATLRYAEAQLYTGTYTGFAGDTAGLYTWQSGVTDWFQQENLSSPAGTLLPYNGSVVLPVSGIPQFMIEALPATAVPGTPLGGGNYGAATPPISVYRITAYSYGGDRNTTAELQEIDWQ